ncbi:MAG: hypothetical protein ABSH27_04665 [Solirubrobacteraceae bacterium]
MNVTWADKNARGPLKLVPRLEYRHPRLFAGVRMVGGVTLLIIATLLIGYDRGGWWRVLLIPAAAADFYVACLLYRLPREARAVQVRMRPMRSDGRAGGPLGIVALQIALAPDHLIHTRWKRPRIRVAGSRRPRVTNLEMALHEEES